jgi:hypothetical protein
MAASCHAQSARLIADLPRAGRNTTLAAAFPVCAPPTALLPAGRTPGVTTAVLTATVGTAK